VQQASGGAISGESSWDAITSYLATGVTTDPALAKMGQASVSGIYAQAFSWTSLISAAFVAVLAGLIAWSLRRPAAKTSLDEFLGLTEAPPEPVVKGL
jgi:hypothetical protein